MPNPSEPDQSGRSRFWFSNKMQQKLVPFAHDHWTRNDSWFAQRGSSLLYVLFPELEPSVESQITSYPFWARSSRSWNSRLAWTLRISDRMPLRFSNASPRLGWVTFSMLAAATSLLDTSSMSHQHTAKILC